MWALLEDVRFARCRVVPAGRPAGAPRCRAIYTGGGVTPFDDAIGARRRVGGCFSSFDGFLRMSTSIRLACPRCQKTIQAQGEAGAALRVKCPQCGQMMQTRIPAAAPATARRPSHRRAAQANQAGAFADLSTDFAPPPGAVPQWMATRAGNQKPIGGGRGKLLAIGGGIGSALILLAATGWYLSSSQAASKSSSGGWFSGRSDSPEDIVDEYFAMLMASEEPREHYGAEQGSNEYEARVDRYLAGEKRSRELLRRALRVDGTDSPELQDSFEERRRQFSGRYRFGIPSQSLQDNEKKLVSDPRLDGRKWKELLKRYMDESFFGLPEPGKNHSARRHAAYVETLGTFARELAQIDGQSDTKDMEVRFAGMIDSIIDYAAATSGLTWIEVHRVHERAEITFQRLISACGEELKAMGVDSEEFENTMADYYFAIRQVSHPESRNGGQLRALLAERRESRKPGYKPGDGSKGSSDESRTAGNSKVNSAPEPAPGTTEDDEAATANPLDRDRDGRPAVTPDSTAATTDESAARPVGGGPSRRPRGGPSGRFSPPGASRPTGTPAERQAAIAARYEGPDRIEIIIHGGSRDTHGPVKAFLDKVGITDYMYSHSGTTATVRAKDARPLKELAAEIEFGEVTETDDGRRAISVAWRADP